MQHLSGHADFKPGQFTSYSELCIVALVSGSRTLAALQIDPLTRTRLKADFHGTILSHAASLRHAYDAKKVVGFENMF